MSEETEQMLQLTAHLEEIEARPVTETPTRVGWTKHSTRHAAESIIEYPQSHINALVKAGVLRKASFPVVDSPVGGPETAYLVIQPTPPHVHQWRVFGMDTFMGGPLTVKCFGCSAIATVSNTLPIEVPEPPHVHEWRVSDTCPTTHHTVCVVCPCGNSRFVPNRVPIEVPE